MATAGIVLCNAVLALLLLAILLLPSLWRAREQARRAVCRSNLRQIHFALVMYSMNCRGKYPVFPAGDETTRRSLSLLLELGYLESPGVFVCLGSRDEQAPGKSEDYNARSNPLPRNSLSFAYSYNLSERSPEFCAVLADKDEHNHWGEGINVAYRDGHVEWQMQTKADVSAVYRTEDRLFADDPGLDDLEDSWLRP
jgi:hypothetical protein